MGGRRHLIGLTRWSTPALRCEVQRANRTSRCNDIGKASTIAINERSYRVLNEGDKISLTMATFQNRAKEHGSL